MSFGHLAQKILIFEERLIDSLLCFLLVLMILLACVQIGLRTFLSGGLLWIDPLLRYLVLWCGLLGAVVATRKRKHIAIDVLGYLAPERVKPWIDLLIDLFSSLVALLLTWAAVIFVRNEALYGGSTLFDIPSWIWNLIFPVAFGFISLHFLLAIAGDIRTLVALLRGAYKGGGV
ncbi:MAG: TRAP transporter small permease [Thermodesulfobacteriota bacterium]